MPDVERHRLYPHVWVSFLALLCLLQTVHAERKKCFTGLGGPGDWDEANWIFLYANRQKGKYYDNPELALYGSDWYAVKRDFPLLAKRALRIKRSFAKHKYKVEKGRWTRDQPFTSICIPSEKGLNEAGLLKDDFVIRINPTGPQTDVTSDLFYKGFIRYGRIWNGYAGRGQH
jgi:hypothetical protein